MTGLELLLKNNFSNLKNSKLAVLANQAAIDSKYNHLVDLLLKSGIKISKIFAPEHGFRGEMQDMDFVADCKDPYTGIVVKSLYGKDEASLAPSVEDLKGIEILLVDLPDIGTRFYTFAQSMIYTMAIAKKANCKVVVLDRPNPINGISVEGAKLYKKFRSFCGYMDTAVRHGLTLGELANAANIGCGEGEEKLEAINCDLEIIKISDWKREQYLDQTKLPWVYPSPNMPTLETAIVYPGSCLFEATEISEGRGTTKPLEQFGAPYINGQHWAEACLKEKITLKGAVLRPISFLPKFQKHAGKTCFGVQLHVTDRNEFSPVRWSLALIASAHRLYNKDFAWRKQTFEFVDKIPAIDLLHGNSDFRLALDQNKDLSSIEQDMISYERKFIEMRKSYLLY